MQVGDILNKLKKVKRLSDDSFLACCPAHKDFEPSLHITERDDRILVSCQAGCDTESVLEELGIKMSDLFKEELPKPKVSNAKPKITDTYDYLDESGKLLFQVVRFVPKDFRQRCKNDKGEWVWKLDNVRRVLYHLPEVLAAPDGTTIILVEGERDADNLIAQGKLATTSSGGASNWKAEYADSLKGKDVIIIPDNDSAGFTYAKNVARSLIGKASVKVVILPKETKDVSDWLTAGHKVTELIGMQQDVSTLLDEGKPVYVFGDDGESILWHKELSNGIITFKAEDVGTNRTGIHARVTILSDYENLSWSLLNVERAEDRVRLSNAAFKRLSPVFKEAYSVTDMQADLDRFCYGLWDAKMSIYEAEMLEGDDDIPPVSYLLNPYIVAGGGTILFAPSGRGKSYTCMIWAQSITYGVNRFWDVKKCQTLLINLERSRDSVKRRVSMVNAVLGLPASTPMLTLNARGKSLVEILAPAKRMVEKFKVKLVILDSISRAGFGDLTNNQPVNGIIDGLSGLCESWAALAHTPRADESHLFGGVMFEAGADVVVRLAPEMGKDGSTIGLGYEITKSNDVPKDGQTIWAMEFNEYGLSKFRRAKQYEFPEIESKGSRSPLLDTMTDYILNQEGAIATAQQISDGTGFNRVNVSKTLSNNPALFIKTRRDKTGQYYGIKGKTTEPLL